MASKWFKACIHFFQSLDQLQKSILSCYFQKEYKEKKYDFEQKIYKSRLKLLGAMKKIRSIMKDNRQKNLTQIENIYEMVFSLNILKLQVTDYATFEICEKEFINISVRLSAVLKHIMALLKKNSIMQSNSLVSDAAKIMGKLSNQTDSLEEVYRSTLQVVSRDPIFFLFFLQNLMALRDELESFILGLIDDRINKK